MSLQDPITFNYVTTEWDDLITDIRNERVVPIIGTEAIELYFDKNNFDLESALKFNPVKEDVDLLLFECELMRRIQTGFQSEKCGFLFYDYLTYKLLSYCLQANIKNGSSVRNLDKININKSAFFFIINTDKNLMQKDNLRKFIKKEIDYIENKIISTSLDKLVQIPFFGLYVSLTIDKYLENSLTTQTSSDNYYKENTRYASSLNTSEDFRDTDAFNGSLPKLYALYGNFDRTRSNDFSIFEEEIIESICRLGITDLKPKNVLKYIKNKNILLIGCKYNDWLLGFFLRLITENRLFTIGNTKKIFADKSFELCQTYLTKDYEIYIENIEAIDFINKLNQTCVPIEGKKIERGGVFISFHSNDRNCIKSLKNILVTPNGIPAWFDEDGLRTGDAILPIIKDNINNSSVFIACISQSTISDQARYFMEEWKYAKKIKAEFKPELVIIPIIIDASIEYNNPFLVEYFDDIKNVKLLPAINTNDCRFNKDDEDIKQLIKDLRLYVREYRNKNFYR